MVDDGNAVNPLWQQGPLASSCWLNSKTRLASTRAKPTHQQLHLANIRWIRRWNKADVFKTTVKQQRIYRLLVTLWGSRATRCSFVYTMVLKQGQSLHITFYTPSPSFGAGLLNLPSTCPLKGLFGEVQICQQHGWECLSLHDLRKAVRKFASSRSKGSARHMPRAQLGLPLNLEIFLKLHRRRPQIEKVGTDGSQRGNQRLPWQGTAGSQTLKLTVPNLGTRGYHCKELPVPRS